MRRNSNVSSIALNSRRSAYRRTSGGKRHNSYAGDERACRREDFMLARLQIRAHDRKGAGKKSRWERRVLDSTQDNLLPALPLLGRLLATFPRAASFFCSATSSFGSSAAISSTLVRNINLPVANVGLEPGTSIICRRPGGPDAEQAYDRLSENRPDFQLNVQARWLLVDRDRFVGSRFCSRCSSP